MRRFPAGIARAAIAAVALVGGVLAQGEATARPDVPFAGAPSRRGSTLVFHGWSPDSRLVAYTRSRMGRTRPDQRMQRFAEAGRFTGFGKMVGGDVERYAQQHGYVVTPAEVRRTDERRFELVVDGETLVLALEIGRAQGWRLTRGGTVLAEHTFDRIYLDLRVELFPAPDRSQAVLVMHLDTGWEIDAAIFPVPL